MKKLKNCAISVTTDAKKVMNLNIDQIKNDRSWSYQESRRQLIQRGLGIDETGRIAMPPLECSDVSY